jgi:VIT1/CCC1 family predicted Fe2+/Mn2+ transporter
MAEGRVHDEPRERGMADLVKELSGQLSVLMHQEIELARTEATEKAKKAGVGAGMLGGAGVAALLMLGSLTAFLILVLALALPDWAAALIVTGVWAVVAGVLALRGREQVREVGKPVPEKTVETMKEDVEWMKDPTRSGTR